jgi:hypothetical protein
VSSKKVSLTVLRGLGVVAVALVAAAGDVGRTGVSVGKPAAASVSVSMSLDELVAASDESVIATAVEKKSRWEDLPSGRRIVTYTRLTVDETLSGNQHTDIWVRTLGGVVDKIGQQVSGEAQIQLDKRALFFLADVEDGAGNAVTIVTGMAQGHYPFDDSGTEPKLKASPDRGAILPRRGPSISAAEVLVGQTVGVARSKIAESADRTGKKH